MAGGLYSRLVTRPTGGTISGPNDDAEWDNIISNALPAKFDDYSATSGQMDSTKDPYPGDVQSLATSLAEEIEHIRWVIDEMHGGSDWYVSEQLLGLSGGTMTGVIVSPAGSAAAPALGWTDTGIYEFSADKIGLTTGGTARFIVDSTGIQANTATGPAVLDEAASSTNPTLVPNKADLDTGVGWNTDELHMVVNGVSVASFDAGGMTGVGSLQTEAAGSGTDIDFTGVPATVKKIFIMLDGISTDGTDYLILQLGDAGGFETSGYGGSIVHIEGTAASSAALSDGFRLRILVTVGMLFSGVITLVLEDSTNNVWACSGNVALTNAAALSTVAGAKALSGALTQIRLTTTGGTDAFDAGAVNVMWE